VTYYQVSLAAGGEVEVLAPSGAAAVGDAVRVAPAPSSGSGAGGAGKAPAPRTFRRTKNSAFPAA